MATTFNPTFAQQVSSYVQNQATEGGFNYLVARVTHVVQGPTLVGTDIPDIYYKNPTSLGTITYQLLRSTQDRTLDSGGNVTAKPMFSAIKQYPLEGEFVLIFPGPGERMNDIRQAPGYYYTPAYNLWNDSHHNAFPDLGDYSQYISDIRRSYLDSFETNQATNTTATGSTTMPLGPNFAEKSNVRSLRQFTGDVTVEGRWGNSIRFGSTSAVPRDANPWSRRGSAPGNPITIIRNGQGEQGNNVPWIPTVENINRDPSSIYLTQGQEIIIDDINNNFSLASLDVVLGRSYTVAVPIQQQLTTTDNTSAAYQDEILLQTGGASTTTLQPTAREISPLDTDVSEEQRLLNIPSVPNLPPRRG